MAVTTITQIKHASMAAGKFFFSPDTMQFFDSRVLGEVFPVPGGALFVTSERDDNAYQVRRYTIRRFYSEGADIRTVGGYLAYKSRNGAVGAARRLAEKFNAGMAEPE